MHIVSAVIVFEADTGKKIAGRYFGKGLKSDHGSQVELEKNIISKATKSSSVLAAAGIAANVSDKQAKESSAQPASVVQGAENNEIILHNECIVLLRLVQDVLVAVVAHESQNDLLISDYLNTIVGALTSVCGNTLSKKKCYDRLDQVFLVFDEATESDGNILEFDVNSIVARIGMASELGATTPGSDSSISSNGGIASAVNSAAVSASVREGLAAISRGDTASLRNMFSGAAQSFSSFMGR